MTRADLMVLLDDLWPNNKLPDLVVAELADRIAKLPLDGEQVRANLTEYRIHCPKYEITTPHAGSLEKRLRVLAYPPETAKPSVGSSEMQDREMPPGGWTTGKQYREWAKANGKPCYLDGEIGQ